MKNKQESIIEQIKTKSISAYQAKEYLYKAFEDKSVSLIKLIINNYPELANQAIKHDYYPLHKVTSIEGTHDRHEVIDLLLTNGANINIQVNQFRQTPLTIAFDRKQIETFDFLLSKGADINVIKLYPDEPYIQYEVNRCLDKLNLDKDYKLILPKLKQSCGLKCDNYDELKKNFDWYHSLSKKYKDEVYKNKFYALLARAKKDGVEYMLVLQDLLLNDCFQDDTNPKSMLMTRYEKFNEQKTDLTSEKIEQLQSSIINLLSITKGGAYYVSLLMTRSDDKVLALKKLISKSKDLLLPYALECKIDETLMHYDEYRQDPLIQLAWEAMDKEAKIEELKAELAELSKENIELKNKPTQQDISSQCKYISVINNAGQELSSSNSEEGNCEIKITGYTIEHTH